MLLQHTNQKQVSKYCNRCFQLEHLNSCIGLNLPLTTITINTRTPISVIHHILRTCGIEFDEKPEVFDQGKEYFKKMTEFNKDQFIEHYDNKQYKPMLYNDCLSILKNGVNLEYYLKCIDKIYTNLYSNQHSKENIYVKLRKSVFKPNTKEYNLSLEILKIPKEVKEKQIKDYQEKVEKNNTHKKTFSYDTLIKNIDSLKVGETKEEMFLFCLLQYGGRCSDLFQNNIEKFSNNEIIVSNIAKKKKEEAETTCVRPLINCTADEFIKIRNHMLSLYKQIYNKDKQINTNIMKLLNDCFHIYFPTETIKITRKLYGAMSYRLYGQTQNMNLFLKRILGHKNVEVSFSYSQIQLE